MEEFRSIFMTDIRDVLYQIEYMIWFAIFFLFWDNIPGMILISATIFLLHTIIAVPALILRNRIISSRELVQHFFIQDVSSSAGESTSNMTLILTITNRTLIFTATGYIIWYSVVYL